MKRAAPRPSSFPTLPSIRRAPSPPLGLTSGREGPRAYVTILPPVSSACRARGEGRWDSRSSLSAGHDATSLLPTAWGTAPKNPTAHHRSSVSPSPHCGETVWGGGGGGHDALSTHSAHRASRPHNVDTLHGRDCEPTPVRVRRGTRGRGGGGGGDACVSDARGTQRRDWKAKPPFTTINGNVGGAGSLRAAVPCTAPEKGSVDGGGRLWALGSQQASQVKKGGRQPMHRRRQRAAARETATSNSTITANRVVTVGSRKAGNGCWV